MTDASACADAYRDLRLRVTALIRASDPVALDAIAPCTPEWRLRDVLAHMAGVNTDIVRQNLDGVGSDAWTAEQVERRRDASIDALLDEWDESASVVEANAEFLGPAAGQWLLDACTHEHDLRHALAQPGARDAPAVTIGYAWGADRLGEHLDRLGVAGMVLVTESGERAVGTTEPRDRVGTTDFELLRAMTGRRSAAQITTYRWSGSPRPEDLVLGLFTVRPTDLVE